ncbi:peptide MFS transporter [Terribacillus saccharophilus]|uniref:MFS transporter n=1 Tax=Terribacillus saccharophilus TaxID=361277 RepID=A0A268A9X5_9BACI|nr:peptide MFS transporter [Terribacillus saccharophilus]PAD20926.1 MFS transporter [Terribacillus saccharophilus]PAF34740.1 MFS transporter [Terribacillus saccharophilus]PAF38206.1 MFS transporter [Terribacillus saccharophilus]
MDTPATIPQGKKHPKGLYLLFFTELWERYSYYGMRSVLMLYLTAAVISGGLGMDTQHAAFIYSLYGGVIYFTPIIGGYLTDKFIGLRTAITIGGITMAIGDFTIFLFNSQLGLYIGILFLIIGNGFFKPNISTYVGDLYDPRDKRKDAAFTIFYMGINLGAFFSPLIAGFLAEDLFHSVDADGIEHFGFKWAFLASSIGMVVGQLIFSLLGKRYLGDIGTKPARTNVTAKNVPAAKMTKAEKKRTGAVLILFVFVIFFWAGFEQAGTSLTLYTRDFIDRNVGGYTIPVSWFQSVNPLFIVILAPIISAVWLKLSKSKRGDLRTTTKMSLGMILLGIGFMVLVPAVLYTGSDETDIVHKANILFIIFTYLFHTIGELCLSPVGLSMISKVAPIKIASLLMGVWMAASGIANIIGGQLAALTATLGYVEIFSVIGAAAIVVGIILLTISKKLQSMLDARD